MNNLEPFELRLDRLTRSRFSPRRPRCQGQVTSSSSNLQGFKTVVGAATVRSDESLRRDPRLGSPLAPGRPPGCQCTCPLRTPGSPPGTRYRHRRAGTRYSDRGSTVPRGPAGPARPPAGAAAGPGAVNRCQPSARAWFGILAARRSSETMSCTNRTGCQNSEARPRNRYRTVEAWAAITN
eukprot:574349-Hanusia_phi.AAC.2